MVIFKIEEFINKKEPIFITFRTIGKSKKKWINNIQNEENETIIKELAILKGVGDWTQKRLLLLAFFWLNIFSVIDLDV